VVVAVDVVVVVTVVLVVVTDVVVLVVQPLPLMMQHQSFFHCDQDDSIPLSVRSQFKFGLVVEVVV